MSVRLSRIGCEWIALALLVLIPAGLAIYGLRLAQSDPIVRHTSYRTPVWPKGTPPMRLLLVSDLHVSNLTTSKARLERIVGQINALKPDVIVLAGDFVGGGVQDHPERIGSALKPLRDLRPRLDTYAVLGNHDHWSDPQTIRQALYAAKIRVLSNSAATVGPLVIGGIDDQYSRSARLIPTELSMLRRQGLPILIAHSPDVFPFEQLPIPLTLAGHTHCGQIALPWFGAIFVPSHFGRRYACGLYSENGRTLVVSGGVGTSQIPLRLFAPPDMWLIEIGPS